jgi:hypothetical protein
MSNVKFKSGDKVYYLPENAVSIDDIVEREVSNAHYNPHTLTRPLITLKGSVFIYYEHELYRTKEDAIKEIIRRKESALIDLSDEIKELYSLVPHSPPKPHYEYSVDSLQKLKDQMIQNPINPSDHEMRPNEETIDAITDAERGDVKTIKTFDEFKADLNDEEISVKIILQRLNSLKKRVEEIEEKLIGDDD